MHHDAITRIHREDGFGPTIIPELGTTPCTTRQLQKQTNACISSHKQLEPGKHIIAVDAMSIAAHMRVNAHAHNLMQTDTMHPAGEVTIMRSTRANGNNVTNGRQRTHRRPQLTTIARQCAINRCRSPSAHSVRLLRRMHIRGRIIPGVGVRHNLRCCHTHLIERLVRGMSALRARKHDALVNVDAASIHISIAIVPYRAMHRRLTVESRPSVHCSKCMMLILIITHLRVHECLACRPIHQQRIHHPVCALVIPHDV